MYPQPRTPFTVQKSTTVDRRNQTNPASLKGTFMTSDATRMLTGKVAVGYRVPRHQYHSCETCAKLATERTSAVAVR